MVRGSRLMLKCSDYADVLAGLLKRRPGMGKCLGRKKLINNCF